MLKSEAYHLMTGGYRLSWIFEEVDGAFVFTCPEKATHRTMTVWFDDCKVTPLEDGMYRFEYLQWNGQPKTDHLTLEEVITKMDWQGIPNEIRPEILQSQRSKNGGRRWIDGQWCRLRRGRWVPIPKKWIGAVTYKETIMSRPSKQGGKRYRKRREH